MDGERDGESFHWESPDLKVTVSEEAAELISLLAASEPEEGVIRCEAKLRGRVQSEGRRLELWVDTPPGVSEELASIATKSLGSGEEARYVFDMVVVVEGRYRVYAYVYSGSKRIGRGTETISASAD